MGDAQGAAAEPVTSLAPRAHQAPGNSDEQIPISPAPQLPTTAIQGPENARRVPISRLLRIALRTASAARRTSFRLRAAGRLRAARSSGGPLTRRTGVTLAAGQDLGACRFPRPAGRRFGHSAVYDAR